MKLPKPKKTSSGTWRVQIMLDGERYSVTADTEKNCVAKAAVVKAGWEDAKRRPLKVTLSQAIDEYIELKQNVLSPSTIRGYRIVQRNRFQDLMKRDVHSVDQTKFQRAVNQEAKLCSAKTLKNAVGLVHAAMLAQGVRLDPVNLPQVTRPVKKYLQPADIGPLIEAIKGDSCEIPILLAVWLGLRRSEISGLCWDCVDMENRILHIRRALVPDEHNQWVLKDYPKNESSQRSIQCPDYIMDLIFQLPRQDEGGRLFPLNPETIRKHTHAACKRAGITDTTVHGLRHTNAAVMKSIGIDDRHAMARGGWTNETTYRRTYSYVFDQDAVASDARIDEFFEDCSG